MRFLKGLAVFTVAGVFAVASIACGDDDIEDNSSSGASGNGSSGASGGSSGASGGSSGASGGSSGASGGSSGNNDFVQYVHDQIVDHTRNNTPTDTLNDKTFTESERSDLFDPAFFAGSYEQ